VALSGSAIKSAVEEQSGIPVMITKSGNADLSDSFLSRGSASIHVVWPVALRPQGAVVVIPPGGVIQVQSPLGFMTPAKASLPSVATPHWAVLLANNGTVLVRSSGLGGNVAVQSVNQSVMITGATGPPKGEAAVYQAFGSSSPLV